MLVGHPEYWTEGKLETVDGRWCAVGVLRAVTAVLGITNTFRGCDRDAYEALVDASYCFLQKYPLFGAATLGAPLDHQIESVNDGFPRHEIVARVEEAIADLRARA